MKPLLILLIVAALIILLLILWNPAPEPINPVLWREYKMATLKGH